MANEGFGETKNKRRKVKRHRIETPLNGCYEQKTYVKK
jgi:hypothetical protein